MAGTRVEYALSSSERFRKNQEGRVINDHGPKMKIVYLSHRATRAMFQAQSPCMYDNVP